MNSHREVPMLRMPSLAVALAAVLATGGCDLNVENPNAPDKNRAFSDPAGLEQLLGGAFSTWVEARDGYFVMPLTTMADNYTASWNNASIRFYTSVGSDCPVRCGWTNSSTAAEAAGGPAVAAQWYGYYTVLSSANDVLAAIKNGICFDDDCAADSTLTQRDKTMAKMLQGMALAGISLIYDQGFVVDETTVLPLDPTAYPPFVTRTAMRDAALQKFEEAYTAAGVEKWSTEADWMGLDGGTAYTNTQIRRLIRTMEAELIAMWPRNSTENGAADWAKVANYGSQGISADTGTAVFDWKFSIDASARDAGIEWVKSWGNSIGTMRVDTRVAKMVDPLSQEDPWPLKNPLTRVTAAITGSGSPQTVTPLAMPTSLTAGRLLAIECAPFDVSCVGDRFVVTAVSPTTFTAVITQSYPGPTTLSAAVTHDTLADGSAKKVAATPASMSGITKGAFLWVDDDTTRNEALVVDSVTATTFYAKFLKNHPSGVAVAPAIHRNGGSPGNWCPLTSPDKRVGDGSYGPSDDFNGYATLKKTANSGTDYACSGVAIFPPARGQYHQSNLQHVRYQYLGGVGEILPGFDGTGQDPFYTRQMNDLLWAEGLIRSGGNKVTAATLINNSRATRGGLSALTGAEADTVLLDALHYEQELEFMGQGATAFFNRRRIGGLIPSTPRQMPVPAKELDVLSRAVYTFGGPIFPDMVSASDGGGGRVHRETVRDRWEQIRATRSSRFSKPF